MNLATTISIFAGGPGSGCRGRNCGRKRTYYHGTTSSNVYSILQNGLKKGRRVYISSNYNTASMYADLRSRELGEKPIVLEIRIPEKIVEKMRLHPDYGGVHNTPEQSFWHSGGIDKKYIKVLN